jgi:hypothetical protein
VTAKQLVHMLCMRGVAHGVAQVAMHSQVAFQGIGVVNDHNSDGALY